MTTLRAGQVAVVSGVRGDAVRVGNVTVTFGSPDSKTLGPFPSDVPVAVLSGSPAITIRPSIGEPVTIPPTQPTVQKGFPMALADKFRSLADRAKAIPQALEQRADALNARLDTLQERGHQAFTGHERFLDGVETGVAAAEDALNQLTNGAPE